MSWGWALYLSISNLALELFFNPSLLTQPKPRSTKWCPIVSLKKFNAKVKRYGFKMETFKQVREWIQSNAYLIGHDLIDHSVFECTNQLGLKEIFTLQMAC